MFCEKLWKWRQGQHWDSPLRLVYSIPRRGSHFLCRPKEIQDLEVNPAYQSSLLPESDLSNSSPDIATNRIDWHTDSLNIPQILPHPTFHPLASVSDRRVNVCWLMSPVFSLCAAFLATLVQQWVRSHMGAFQRSSQPLKTARVRQFLFEGVDLLPLVAEAEPDSRDLSMFPILRGGRERYPQYQQNNWSYHCCSYRYLRTPVRFQRD